jgi:small subunit ribosomal protein S6
MNQYEIMYVIDAALEDSSRVELIDRFSDLVKKNGGEIDRIDEWGKRRLAYAINYKTEGYYVLMYVKAPSEMPKELERNFQINDKVLRSLVIRYEGEVPAKREPLKPYVAREAAPVEAVAEAAPAAAVEVVDDEKPVSEAE